MSFPSVLGPWFVVQRLRYTPAAPSDSDMPIEGVEYFQHSEEEDALWTTDKRRALLFMSLHGAARIAESESAEVRVLTTKKEAEEFNRG